MSGVLIVCAAPGPGVIACTPGQPDPTGAYLKALDLAFRDGAGAALWTRDKAQALRFDTLEEAFAFWRQVSTVKPVRDDGKPNRPLTAYTVTFDMEDEEEQA